MAARHSSEHGKTGASPHDGKWREQTKSGKLTGEQPIARSGKNSKDANSASVGVMWPIELGYSDTE